MRSSITEFSYGFSLTYELVSRFQLFSAAPEFPNLRQEALSGYDVRLLGGVDAVFLQFKLSEFLTRSTALAAPWLGVPHYRFSLMPSRISAQHDRLLELERQGQSVFYATPMFHTPAKLDRAFRNGNMVAESAFFNPESIGRLPDDLDHTISFVPSHSNAWFCTETKKINRWDGISLFREVLPSRSREFRARADKRLRNRELGRLLLDTLRRVGGPETTQGPNFEMPPLPTTIPELMQLSRTYFGAELLYI